ncbi:MAG: substrate-binding domain-containing protein [Candidatus Goldbacteria bacterium]|nr:substrate-binding domain-containing protein [Candidatus Goldiibacteriota bacterium]
MNKKTGAKIKSKAAFNTIAFISGRMGSVFNSTVAKGIENHIARLGGGKKSILYHLPRDSSAEACSAEIIDVIKQGEADGLICLSFTPTDSAVRKIIKSKIPAVFIERKIKGLHSVKVDNFKGGYTAGEYLAKRGYKKAGLIIDPQCRDEKSASYERLMGFKSALDFYGIKPVKGAAVTACRHSIECGRDVFEEFEGRLKGLDSVFSVAGDLVAIGFMMEAKAGGIRFPKDIALIGYDGVEAAKAVTPVLTTIKQPIETMGMEAVEIINGCLKGGLEGEKHIDIDTEMAEGGTV